MTDPGQHPLSGHTWASALDRAAERYGERAAFEFEGVDWAATLDFSLWRQASRTVAAGLADLGVGHGDRVGLLALGGPVWPVLQTACSHLGAILVPLNVRYRVDELSFVLGLCTPRVIFTVARILETNYPELLGRALPEGHRPAMIVLDRPDLPLSGSGGDSDWGRFLDRAAGLEVPPAAGRADDPVLLQFTSGTTAFPKGALLSNRAALGATWYLGARMGLTEADRFFSTQPFYHVGGSVATTLPPLASGCTMVVPERYQVEEVARLIHKHRCTARTGQAAMYAMELAHPDYDPTKYSTLQRGWAAGTPRLKRMIVSSMGITELISTYGLTETAGTCTAADHRDPLETRLDTNGPALPGLDVAIAALDENRAPGQITTSPNVVGEVYVRGWALTDGYFGDPGATAETLDTDGWLHTGDLGYLDEGGNLLIVDRLKDMIKPGGENVSAAEVERVIGEVAGVSQVAVVGRPDGRLGEVPVAFVESAPGAAVTEELVLNHCRERMASFKVPRQVLFTATWPLTESGKIQKHVLRRRLQGETDELVGKTG